MDNKDIQMYSGCIIVVNRMNQKNERQEETSDINLEDKGMYSNSKQLVDRIK